MLSFLALYAFPTLFFASGDVLHYISSFWFFLPDDTGSIYTHPDTKGTRQMTWECVSVHVCFLDVVRR